MNKAVIVIDYINEICHEKGKLSQKGYKDFIDKHDIIFNINSRIKQAKENNELILFISVGFDKNYSNCPSKSPLFSAAKQYKALEENTWATEILEEINFNENEDILIQKSRIDSTYNTKLLSYLSINNIFKVEICGVATDLAVLSCAFSMHDKDYEVEINEKCCAAANEEDHNNALKILKKISKII